MNKKFVIFLVMAAVSAFFAYIIVGGAVSVNPQQTAFSVTEEDYPQVFTKDEMPEPEDDDSFEKKILNEGDKGAENEQE